jgi:hypothetical protein
MYGLGRDRRKAVRRGRLLPLIHVKSSSSWSRRVQQRLSNQKLTTSLSNNVIHSINYLYSSSLPVSSSALATPAAGTATNIQSSDPLLPSAVVDRLQQNIWQSCQRFQGSCRRGNSDSTTLACLSGASSSIGSSQLLPGDNTPDLDSLLAFLPSYISSQAAMPIIAGKIDLPDKMSTVPLIDKLPPSASTFYRSPSLVLLSSPSTTPMKRARVYGPRSEYLQLIKLMYNLRMVEFRSNPLAVNGVFAVPKDGDRLRLIIDAQPANSLCIEPDPVLLPNPAHLARLQKVKQSHLYSAKLDLSNFYHQLRLPDWMVNLFGLPPLSDEEMVSIGLPSSLISDRKFYPCCTSLPMGWSHSVLIAQLVHERVMYLGPQAPLRLSDSVLRCISPLIDRCLHLGYIDDLCFISCDRELAHHCLNLMLLAYQFHGLEPKVSKMVLPTSDPVDLLGVQVHGDILTISSDYISSLVQMTMSVLQLGVVVSGRQMARVVGKWTWVLLLRRPALSCIQHAYRFIEVAGSRSFQLWPSVRKELYALLGLLPMLYVDLSSSWSTKMVASDASLLGGGVCVTGSNSQLLPHVWSQYISPPLHSAFRKPYSSLQPTVNDDMFLSTSNSSDPPSVPRPSAPLSSSLELELLSEWSALVQSLHWGTIISQRWNFVESINRLECRAVLLALRWFISYPSSINTRLPLLLDSQVVASALRKGRCASSLLPVLRKVNALLLASNIHLLPLWIPTDANPADVPSRCFEGVVQTSSYNNE